METTKVENIEKERLPENPVEEMKPENTEDIQVKETEKAEEISAPAEADGGVCGF